MVDRVISVLVIGNGWVMRETLHCTPPANLVGGATEVGDAGMKMQRVRGLEQAGDALRYGRFDAILLDRVDLAAIDCLQACAGDRPILAIVEEDDVDSARQAIAGGAQDILLPVELADGGLRRRIELAIARKGAERHRLCHARDDALTGLANATLLEERFIRAMARADRFATLVGLVAIDLDGFDAVIANHGRRSSDRLLTMAGHRLLDGTRQTDTLARTRDHGFTWLVEGLPAIDDINALIDRLPERLEHPFSLDECSIRLTASVGVAICPFHGKSFHAVHGMAEAAMLDVATISGDALLTLPIRSATLT